MSLVQEVNNADGQQEHVFNFVDNIASLGVHRDSIAAAIVILILLNAIWIFVMRKDSTDFSKTIQISISFFLVWILLIWAFLRVLKILKLDLESFCTGSEDGPTINFSNRFYTVLSLIYYYFITYLQAIVLFILAYIIIYALYRMTNAQAIYIPSYQWIPIIELYQVGLVKKYDKKLLIALAIVFVFPLCEMGAQILFGGKKRKVIEYSDEEMKSFNDKKQTDTNFIVPQRVVENITNVDGLLINAVTLRDLLMPDALFTYALNMRSHVPVFIVGLIVIILFGIMFIDPVEQAEVCSDPSSNNSNTTNNNINLDCFGQSSAAAQSKLQNEKAARLKHQVAMAYYVSLTIAIFIAVLFYGKAIFTIWNPIEKLSNWVANR